MRSCVGCVVRCISDGDTDPDGVIAWYVDHGYNFLSITDHNHITAPADYSRWESEDFILISGNEVSDACRDKPIHLLALGLYDESVKPAHGETIRKTMQNNIDVISAAGALPVLAHPNFGWAFGAEEMAGVEGCRLFEVLNAHPAVNNAGDDTHQSTEEMWDTVLSTGKVLYGIGTDDMHVLATYPGKSWVMVRAEELTEEAILDVLHEGAFYVSTGVVLRDVEPAGSADPKAQKGKNLKITIADGPGAPFKTQFIGRDGSILKEDTSLKPVYKFKGDELYVRARISDAEGRLALIQPVFTDK